MKPTLQTERLILRPVLEQDAGDFSRFAGDIRVARMTGSIPSPFPILAAEIRCLLFRLHWKTGREYSYAITTDGSALRGIVSLFRRGQSECYEIGYWLAEPIWGLGYASEACRAILREGAQTLGLQHVNAGVYEDNPASMRVLEKCGFKKLPSQNRLYAISRLKKVVSRNFELVSETILERYAQSATHDMESRRCVT